MDNYRHDMNQVFLRRLTEITEENLTNEHFNVEDLARAMNMSHTKLYRKLKCLSHQTINQFIREVRLRKAHELLLNEDVTASEVAYRTGFGSPTYFNKCFHEFYGYSPLEFKKHEMQKEDRFFSSLFNNLRSKASYLLIFIALAIVAIFSFFLLMNNKSNDSDPNFSKKKTIFSCEYKSNNKLPVFF